MAFFSRRARNIIQPICCSFQLIVWIQVIALRYALRNHVAMNTGSQPVWNGMCEACDELW